MEVDPGRKDSGPPGGNLAMCRYYSEMLAMIDQRLGEGNRELRRPLESTLKRKIRKACRS